MGHLTLLFLALVVLQLGASLYPPHHNHIHNCHCKPWPYPYPYPHPHPPPHRPPPSHQPPSPSPRPPKPPSGSSSCSGKKECAVARIRARTLLIPLSSTLRNLVKEQIDRRLELFGLGKLKNNVEVEVRTIFLLRYVIVRFRVKCCPKILQIVLDALNAPELTAYVIPPPMVWKYCSSRSEPCPIADDFIDGL